MIVDVSSTRHSRKGVHLTGSSGVSSGTCEWTVGHGQGFTRQKVAGALTAAKHENQLLLPGKLTTNGVFLHRKPVKALQLQKSLWSSISHDGHGLLCTWFIGLSPEIIRPRIHVDSIAEILKSTTYRRSCKSETFFYVSDLYCTFFSIIERFATFSLTCQNSEGLINIIEFGLKPSDDL